MKWNKYSASTYASHQFQYIPKCNNSLYWHSERAIQISTSLKSRSGIALKDMTEVGKRKKQTQTDIQKGGLQLLLGKNLGH